MNKIERLKDLWGIQINYAFGHSCMVGPVGAHKKLTNGMDYLDYYLILGVN